jgi:hypothetical protein
MNKFNIIKIVLFIYHGQGLTEQEFELMAIDSSRLLILSNFLWRISERELASMNARRAQNDRRLIGIVFRIEAPASIPYLAIETSQSNSNSSTEKLFLFNKK